MITRTAAMGITMILAAGFAGTVLFSPPLAVAAEGPKGHKHDQPAQKPHDHSQHKHDEHSNKPGKPGEHANHNMEGGMPGKAADVTRTVLILAKDTEFNLKKIQVKAGETVRFVVKNKGELVHEFTIGTPEMQKAHQEEMMKLMDKGLLTADKVSPDARHSHGNSAIVEPGKQGEVIWTFAKAQTLEFGCNIPGHYDQGMKGDFVIGGGV